MCGTANSRGNMGQGGMMGKGGFIKNNKDKVKIMDNVQEMDKERNTY